MLQSVGKRRSGWAVLAVGALVASLLVVGSAPAGAAEIKAGHDNTASPNKRPSFSACVGDAMRDAGFSDTDGLVAEDAINCLAYYGITRGKTAERFDAGSEVTRSQMALFLYRAADVAGLNLMGGTGAADFDDIDDLDEERQDAIKALARNNILTGTGMAFNPDVSITRAQMAVALIGFLRHASPALFHQSGRMKDQLILTSEQALDHFADARRSLPRSVDAAISYAYELGITTGSAAGADKFSPNDPVLRKNMASFITRTLAHTNVRPAGLTAQAVAGTITASIRDAGFDPVSNEIVDAFYIATASEDRAFSDLGACRPAVKAVDGGSGECVIGVVDPATNADGNVAVGTLNATAVGKGVTVWLWTGDAGDRFDADRVDSYKMHLKPQATVAATKMTVKPDMPAQARFGTEVVFTAQLQYTDSTGADKDTSVGTDGRGPARYKLQRKVFRGNHDSVPADSQIVSVSEEKFHWTDSDGKITFALTTTDPNPSAAGDFRTVQYTLTNVSNAPTGDPMTKLVVFSDAPPKVTTVKAEPARKFVVLPAAGATETNSVTATVLDQYGTPMRNISLEIKSNLNVDANNDNDFTDSGDTLRSELVSKRSTGSSGTARFAYTHRGSDTASKETLTVTYKPASGSNVEGTAGVFWLKRATDAAQTTALEVIDGDVAADTVVLDSDTGAGVTPLQVRYDGNDVFRLSGEFKSLAEFEAALAKIYAPGDAVTGKLKWSSYNPDDEDDIAEFDLNASGGGYTSTTTTTTVRTGNAATNFTVKSGSVTFPSGSETTFATATYGESFEIVVQTTDSNGANTGAGVDGKTAATFLLQYVSLSEFPVIVRRDGASFRFWWGATAGRITSPGARTATDTRTSGINGRTAFSYIFPDRDPDVVGTKTAFAFVIRAGNNAPGYTEDLGTTKAVTGHIRISEPPQAARGGGAATDFTVTSGGVTFTSASVTTFAAANFGETFDIVVQLKNAQGENTGAGADGTGAATFSLQSIRMSDYLASVTRSGSSFSFVWATVAGRYIGGSRTSAESKSTDTTGRAVFSNNFSDHAAGTAGTKGAFAFVVRAGDNAPGATDNYGTTKAVTGHIRLSESS